MTSKPIPRWAALGLSVALVGTACGSGGDTTSTAGVPALDEVATDPTTPPAQEPTAVPDTAADATEAPAATAPPTATEAPAEEAAAEPAGENQLPDVDVVDLATGQNVNLASFAPADRPIVLWFWAPH